MPHSPSLGPVAGDALIVVDVQNDFLPGGALAVPRGDEVVSVVGRYLRLFHERALPIYATRDWHPPNHVSFREQGGPWPPHCVAGTLGAAFAPGLRLPPGTVVVNKADRPDEDAYSAFQGSDLAGRLRQAGIRRLFIGGLATDYCVLNTVRDARNEGFEVVLITDACRAIDAKPGDGAAAELEMRRLGAEAASFTDLLPSAAVRA
ncbi:MAG: nicotinamidase [Gammaproteobacteria bacterium]|jgi:nicotinamidase/pyrazinamidase|nr:nicotinamidase [Gammaproteobacteria bacterium]